jgi:hypothetical protein
MVSISGPDRALAQDEREGDQGAIHRELYRCDVTTGACKLLVKDADNLTLQQP